MLTVLVCYNDDSIEKNYKRILSTHFKKLGIKDLIIVNTKSKKSSILDHKGQVICSYYLPRANDEMEFSGYYEGIKLAFDKIGNVRECLFLNDTVFTHGRLRKCEVIALMEYALKLKVNLMSNKIEKNITGFLHKSEYLKDISSFHEYINSKFFIIKNLSQCEYHRLFNIGGIDVELDLIEGYKNNIYKDKRYGRFLHSWLNNGGWYKSKELTNENVDLFKLKARSIIHEHYMSDPSNGIFDSRECLIKKSIIMKLISRTTGFSY